MARQFYTPKVKTAILNAVKEARAAKKSWAEAHAAGRAAGYKGGLPAIIKMVRIASGKAPAKSKKGPGRPPKVAGKRRGRPPGKVGTGAGLGSVEVMVERIVKQRVQAALDRAIAVLKAV